MSSPFRIQQLLSEFVLNHADQYKSANHVLDYVKSYNLNTIPSANLGLFLDRIVLGTDSLLARFSQNINQAQHIATKPLMKLLRIITNKIKEHHRKSDLLPYLPALELFSYNVLVVYPARASSISPGTRALALRLLIALYETNQQWVPQVAGLAPLTLLASLREIYLVRELSMSHHRYQYHSNRLITWYLNTHFSLIHHSFIFIHPFYLNRRPAPAMQWSPSATPSYTASHS